MNITGYDQQSKLLEWAERLAASIEPDDVDTAQSIRAAIDQYRKHRFLLAVLGKAKRGKSTLVNAFLGRADDLVAPIDRLPASSTITKFSWARQEAACVRFRDRSEAITFDKIRDYVIEDRNPGNVKGVTLVEVSGPFAHLDPDLDLVDTPGAGSIHEHHDVLLHGFLPQADATLFLVTASMPLDQDELELLKRIKKADIRKLFFAINKVDNASEDEIDAAIIHNRSLLAGCGIQVGTIHRISARRAFAGDLANSGLLELVAELNSFLTTEKGRVFSERFVARVHETAQSVLDGFTIEAAASRKTRSELDAELERLQTERRGLESELRSCEEIFLSDWNRAIDEFERNLLSARSVVAREVNDRIEAVTVLGVNALAQELPTLIARSTERSLHESAPIGKSNSFIFNTNINCYV